jgi:DNA-binding NtrC family response regulator
MMLNILWVEDDASDAKKTQWFKDRPVELITDFTEAEQKITSDVNQYDVVVLDINLENSEQTDAIKKYAEKLEMSPKEFLVKAGINLYFISHYWKPKNSYFEYMD